MDTQHSCCPKCNKQYCIKTLSPLTGRIPLLLSCKHSVCETCITVSAKLNEPLQCPLCDQAVELPPKEEVNLILGTKFPINTYILGQLVLELAQSTQADSQENQNPYIDLKEIIEKTNDNIKTCSECKGKSCFKCTECKSVLCEKCFHKIHNAFESLKSHTMEELGFNMPVPVCQVHQSVDMAFYCETCSKPLCLNCLLTGDKACASHKTISIEEKNISERDKLKQVFEKGDELFRRLSKTAVDIGNRLDMTNSETNGSSQASIFARNIQYHYAKLHAYLQMQEREKLAMVRKMSQSDLRSLEQAKLTVEKSLTQVKSLLNKLKYCIAREDVKVNILSLVEEMDSIVKNTPWYLSKLEQPEDKLTFNLNAEVFKVLEEHLTLDGSMECGYGLLPTKDIPVDDIPPAPPRPVFPPEIIVQDVREKDKKEKNSQNGPFEKALKVPKEKKEPLSKHKHNIDFVPSLKMKSGSISSLNSNESGSLGRYTVLSQQADEPPRTLEEGTQEMVYLAHVIDPEDFYVHRVCMQKKRRELKNHLVSAASFTKPAESQVTEGKLFLSLNKLNNQFQRCRIISINIKYNPTQVLYDVFYIDFGVSNVVTLNELRMLPTGLALIPPLALHCKLANVLPISGRWDPDDTLLMHQIASDKKTVMYIRRSLGANSHGLALECDLTTFDDEVNVAKALVFHERARFINPYLKYERIGIKMDMPKLHYNADMKRYSTEEVNITHIVSPDKFFIRKSYMQNQFDKLYKELNEAYSGMKGKINQVFCPEVGMLVACNTDKYAEVAGGGGWRRGVVKALASQLRVVLTLPDSGHEITVHVSTLRILQQRFYHSKALAVECHLSFISPTNKKWSKASLLSLEQYAAQTLQVYVTELPTKNRSMGLILYDCTDGHNIVCINQEFIKAKYAVNIGALSFAFPNANRPLQNMAPVTTKKEKPRKVPEVQILKKEPKVEETVKSQNLDVIVDRGPVKLEVKIVSCQSPSQLYVSLVSQQEEIQSLSEELNTFYNATPPSGKDSWQPDEKCCFFDQNEKMWKRATVLQIEGESARIFCSDFAEIESVPTTKLLPLVADFQKMTNGVFKCHLASIMPAGGDEWPGITCESLSDIVEQYNRHFITKKGNVKDKSMPIELWVYHETPGGALEPSKGEWQLINAKLVQKGLAIPDRDASEETATDDTLSLFAATGTVSQWLQFRSSQAEEDRLKAEVDTPEIEGETPTVQPPRAQAIPLQNWLPPVPVQEKQFDAFPTFVDNEGHIYLHNVNSADMLSLIMYSLNSACNNSKPVKDDTPWVVNQACVALYGLDNNYYRGRVHQVLDKSTCSVYFVDYGNIEVCSVENMRRELLTLDIPILALKCVLSGINIVGGKRRLQAIEYAHRIIVDKLCTVKILEQVEDIYKIELIFKGQNIKNLLVDTHYATFVDTDENCLNVSFDSKSTNIPTDSDPDYIIEEDSISDNNLLNQTNMQKIDWNKMIEEEMTVQHAVSDFLRYPPVVVPTDANGNFTCFVQYINNITLVHLSVVELDADVKEELNRIIIEIQAQGPSQPVIEEMYEEKACVALYEDGSWYRTSVIQYDNTKNQVKVQYVDFGNSSIVEREKVRESKKEWCTVPPRVIHSELHNIRERDASCIPDITVAYKQLMLTSELVATVLERKHNSLTVELRKEVDGPLVYQNLIDEGLLVLKPSC